MYEMFVQCTAHCIWQLLLKFAETDYLTIMATATICRNCSGTHLLRISEINEVRCLHKAQRFWKKTTTQPQSVHPAAIGQQIQKYLATEQLHSSDCETLQLITLVLFPDLIIVYPLLVSIVWLHLQLGGLQQKYLITILCCKMAN